MTDTELNYGPCVICGAAENDPEWVSRLPCENCGRVICHRCADTGVYGSLPDFRHFVTGPFKSRGRPFHLNLDSCPFCKTMAWMKKYGG